MSDDVSQFLQQVEELKGRRIEEDEARSRELEERILQERSERAARRAERARSISPQKSSSPATRPPILQRSSIVVTDNLRLESPSHRSTSIKSEDSKMDSFSNSSTKENESGGSNGIDSKIHDESQTMRSFREPSTPSWQRRPSQSPDKHDRRARPLSVLATENAYARSNTPTDTSVSPSRDKTLTKDQIAQALGSKDSNWFRQTADRGANSAAYRRNQVEDDDRSDVGSSRKGLPGMVPEHPALPTSPRHGILDLAASPKLDPPSYSNNAEGLDHARPDRSPTGRMASNRPISPTKGLGGFVQSAMMKRSDSVKRWSVTSPAGLARAESIAANRTGSRPNNLIRDIPSMPLHKSHPSSRQSSHEREKSMESPAPALQPSDPIFDPSYVSKISVPNSTDRETQDASKSTDEVTPPSSPSKAMDTRRWSPTKASWLETALNKPESPKKTHTPSLSQPAWMVELNKAKAHKTGGAKPEPENTKGPVVKHEVKIGGLMRNIPMGSTVSPTPVSGVFPPPTTSVPGSTHTKPVSPTITAAPEEIKPVVNKPSAPLISSKPKPELPPSASSKVDFRSTLKTRKTSPSVSEGSGGSEELKAVFGSLRKTTTQNYVAPDELKNTILKGKSGLVFTGGPKKSEIKDEFKQDILKKRESFKQAQQEGRGIRPNSGSVSRTEAPEGLEKFKQLGRGSVVSGSPFSPLSKSVASPQTPAKPASFSIRQNMQSVETATNKLTQKVQESVSKPKAEPPTKAYGRSIGGGLDGAFNNSLAGLLARGPPPMTSSASNKATGLEESDIHKPSASLSGTTETPTAPGPQLTHLTKGRARGPRRKAPSSKPVTIPANPPVEESVTSVAPPPSENPATEEPKPSSGDAAHALDSPSTKEADVNPRKFTRILPTKPEVEALASSGQPRGTSPLPENEPLPIGRKPWQPVTTPTSTVDRPLPPMGSRPLPTVTNKPAPSRPEGKGFFSSRVNASYSSRLENKDRSDTPMKPAQTLPIASPKPSFNDPERSVPMTPQSFKTLGAKTPSKEATLDFTARSGHATPPPKTISAHATGNSSSGTPRSLTKPAMDAAAALSEFFGDKKPQRDYHVDTADILMKRPQASQVVKTHALKLFQLSGDGRQIPVLPHNERILFEQEMYICIHSFVSVTGGSIAQVYFWAGDDVPAAEVEDAQVFANREAKAADANLIRMAQGRETAEFIDALGGVLIIRRGSSNRFDSLSPSMLCGRKHLGQVIFDEIDFSSANLCSGFPYLISKGGRCVLWKGKGSDVQELSCARLIGMDLTLMGELEEVDDGHEPESLWSMFNGSPKPHSADHWRLKPNYDMYSSRLFKSDASTKQQIIELSPFNQADLEPTNIYVIDAFFEMYIIVGAKAQTQYASFRNALDFAQEYAILASGMEDRPFVPISTVVLEGIPRDLKGVFRKWSDDKSPTAMASAPESGSGLKRARSLRIVPLSHALQAFLE
ncbi:gelsolin repeat protein [Ceratocystis lukuohia]|uniref:Gelsolin repeat protein n=1 Tax=Ceratocystis lukuohia TaxID=2019550 RepID=A0ABR4MDS9_9PEZI